MKLFFTYFIFIIALCGQHAAFGQEPAPSIVSFSDSVKLVLEKSRAKAAVAVATDFATQWSGLSPDVQEQLKSQIRMIAFRGYATRPYLQVYLSAFLKGMIALAEDPASMTAYMNVSDRVIDRESQEKTLEFFTKSEQFFLHHSLQYSGSFRLYTTGTDFSFDYIGTPEPPPVDTTATVDLWAEPVYDTTQSSIPSWMQPPPPPYFEGPVIRFDRTDLAFVTRFDSAFVQNTKGTYSFNEHVFVGEEGKFDWSSAGLKPDSVFCTFAEYFFDVNKPELTVEMAQLNFPAMLSSNVPGQFEFKSVSHSGLNSSYPRFRSYEGDISMNGWGDETVEYRGGISLEGKHILSTDINQTPGMITVRDGNGMKFRSRSKEFSFVDSAIVSDHATVIIYQDNDSIVHHSVRLKYNPSSKDLLLQGTKDALKSTPYSASFFNVDFSADIIKWNTGNDSINIYTQGGRTTVPMVIESIDYYDPADFWVLLGKGFNFHPLGVVANYCIQADTLNFYLGELITATNIDALQLKDAIEFLRQKGLVNYDPSTDRVFVKPKLLSIWHAFKQESDYDNLKIQSVIDNYPNATIRLRDRNMVVRGVDEFKVSDSLNVLIEPDSSIITILQNRDIKFNGKVTAGNFEITGKDFTLKYDSFFVNLKEIDSINFYSTEKNARGQTIRKKINNSLVGADSLAASEAGLANSGQSSGTLYISIPDNKSGRLKIPNYPRLDATTGGVIYFDRPEVLGGVYDRSVFFVVPPFKLDSLNDADPTTMNFDGTFVSSGMFPSFKEKLHTMSDKSLGFQHEIPKEGYFLFKGEGKAMGTLSLDNKGLRINGSVDYLAAHITSGEFTFYPDSVITSGKLTGLEEKQFGSVKFPKASFPDYKMKWYPKKDEMEFKTTVKPFLFYDSSAWLTGTVGVSKNGVSGYGKLETKEIELVSPEMNFTTTDYGARHARFKAKSADPDKPLINGTDVRIKANLGERFTDISPEIEGEAAIDFPYAQFRTSIPNARLDLNEQKITMNKRPDVPLENSYFYTTRKDLDSLSFNADKAVYDLKTQELKVSGIPYITVADAKITPDNGEVLILENARIGTLTNTTIEVDTLNGYHHLTDGVVNIISRKEFTGSATYQYVNLLKDTFSIKMTDFHLEPVTQTGNTGLFQRKQSQASLQTVATGAVSEDQKLILGAGMFYKGQMTMYATRPALQLNGFVALDIKKLKEKSTWIKYSQTGEETEILIDFDNVLSEERSKLDAGLHFRSTDNSLYITFASEKLNEDEDFFLPSGSLHYDTESKEFRIEDMEKAAGNKLSGKVFAYNDETSRVRFEGPVNLFNGLNDFEVTASAIGLGDIQTGEISMNSFVMVTPKIPVEIFNLMAADLQNVVKYEGAEEGVGDLTELLYKIADIVGERSVKDFEQKSLKGYFSLGNIPALASPLVFAKVDLKWSEERKAFYSTGKLGLSNILKNDINGSFDGFIESKKSIEGSPSFNIFIKASSVSWYYFGLEDNQLLVYSSKKEFNDLVAKKTNAGKTKVGELVFVPGSQEETLSFINRYRKDYLGIETPYSLNDGASAPTQQIEKKSEKKDDGKKVDVKKEDDGF